MSIPELAASIQRVGLLQNLMVTATADGERYEVVAEGRPIEDIAADFSVTRLVMQRLLKLANVSLRPLADYQAEAVSLDQLMALAINDDQAAQPARTSHRARD